MRADMLDMFHCVVRFRRVNTKIFGNKKFLQFFLGFWSEIFRDFGIEKLGRIWGIFLDLQRFFYRFFEISTDLYGIWYFAECTKIFRVFYPSCVVNNNILEKYAQLLSVWLVSELCSRRYVTWLCYVWNINSYKGSGKARETCDEVPPIDLSTNCRLRISFPVLRKVVLETN